MRTLFIIFLFVAICLDTHCMALPNGCWLPEPYVLSISSDIHLDTTETLNPFANILIRQKEISVKLYWGESPQPVQFRYVGGRVEILNVALLIDPDYLNLQEVKASKYYLSFEGDILILTIAKGQSERHIRYVKEFQGFLFTSYHDALFRLRVSRIFHLDEADEYVSFSMEGSVQGSSKWSHYELLRDYPYLSNGKAVTLVRLSGPSAKQVYAVEISDNMMRLYEYRSTKYDIVLSPTPTYELHLAKE